MMSNNKDNWPVVGLVALSLIATIIGTRDVKTARVELAECRAEITAVQEHVKNQGLSMNYFNERLYAIEVKMDVAVPKPTKPINYDYDYVLRVVAAESKGESLEGQMAVAQTICETAKATGQTPEQVVKVPGQYAPPDSMSAVNDSVREACERVFLLNEKVTEEPIRYFYSTVGGFYSRWHENSLEYVMTIGNHKFFKAK